MTKTNLRLRTIGVAAALVLGTAACDRPEPVGEQTAVPTAPPGAAPTGADPAARPVPSEAEQAQAGGTEPSTSGPVAGAERAFVADAAASGLAEVEAARLVATRTNNPQIKEYAERMEREHRAANEELQRMAMAKGIDLPANPEGAPRERLNRLNGVTGAELERTYMQEFGIDAHQQAIELFERQARDGQDPELRTYAERTLPTLREHLHLARQLQPGGAGEGGGAGGGSR